MMRPQPLICVRDVEAKGNADSWVYVYNANDLSFIAKYETQEVFHGAGGIGVRNGNFFVVGVPTQADYIGPSKFRTLAFMRNR